MPGLGLQLLSLFPADTQGDREEKWPQVGWLQTKLSAELKLSQTGHLHPLKGPSPALAMAGCLSCLHPQFLWCRPS